MAIGKSQFSPAQVRIKGPDAMKPVNRAHAAGSGERGLVQAFWRSVVRAVYDKPDMPVDLLDLAEMETPISVGTEIINICNANCSFCGYGKGEKGKAADPRVKGKLSDEVFHHTLKLFSEAGGGQFTLSPILGEVSAHPRWLEMVAAARAYPNITGVSCFTNAILLDRFGSEAILTSGLTAISISTCLSSPEEYRRLYGVDKYEQVVANTIDLLETNRRLGNKVSIDLLLRMDKPFEPFFESEIYRTITSYVSPSRIEILDDLWDDFSGIIGEDGIPRGHVFKDTSGDKSVPCYALYRKLEVLTDGTIQACACRVEPDLWTGNVLDYESLREAWHNPKLEALRENWHNGNIPEPCQRCSHYMPSSALLQPAQPAKVARKAAQRLKKSLLG